MILSITTLCPTHITFPSCGEVCETGGSNISPAVNEQWLKIKLQKENMIKYVPVTFLHYLKPSGAMCKLCVKNRLKCCYSHNISLSIELNSCDWIIASLLSHHIVIAKDWSNNGWNFNFVVIGNELHFKIEN